MGSIVPTTTKPKIKPLINPPARFPMAVDSSALRAHGESITMANGRVLGAESFGCTSGWTPIMLLCFP